MTTPALDDVLTPETADEIEETFLEIGATLGLPTTAWQPGGVARTILAIVANVVAALWLVVVAIAKGGLLDYATGVWLTLLARNGYGVERIAAASGVTTMTLTNANVGGLGPYAVGALHFVNTTTGKTYRSTTAVVSVAGGGGTASVDIIADEVGTGSNAAPTEIALLDGIIGLSASNASTLVGVAEELDADLVQRCKDKLGALSPNGAASAYAYVAKTPTLNGGVSVNRVRVAAANLTGTVAVTIAGPSGVVSGPNVTLVDTALKALATPLCVTETTASAAAVNVTVTCDVYVSTEGNLTSAQVQALVSAKLLAIFPLIPIGGYSGVVYLDWLKAQIESVSPYVFHATLTSPGADVNLTSTQIASLNSTITTVVHQVTP